MLPSRSGPDANRIRHVYWELNLNHKKENKMSSYALVSHTEVQTREEKKFLLKKCLFESFNTCATQSHKAYCVWRLSVRSNHYNV